VGSGQKYDPNSPIVDVMLDTLIKRKMGNSFNEADVRYKYIDYIDYVYSFFSY